jgi:hypothetical protein
MGVSCPQPLPTNPDLSQRKLSHVRYDGTSELVLNEVSGCEPRHRNAHRGSILGRRVRLRLRGHRRVDRLNSLKVIIYRKSATVALTPARRSDAEPRCIRQRETTLDYLFACRLQRLGGLADISWAALSGGKPMSGAANRRRINDSEYTKPRCWLSPCSRRETPSPSRLKNNAL